MRILVTGANGDIADAAGRILVATYPDAVVHGADAGGKWPGALYFSKVHRVPFAADPAYSTALVRLASEYDLIIPTSDAELARLAVDPGPAIDLPLLMIRRDLAAIFTDKLETAHWLAQIGLDPPATRMLRDASAGDLPLLIKPRRGAGAKGHEIVRTAARLAVAKTEHPDDTVAQELIEVPDQEYTCALFAHAGEVRALALRRWLVDGRTDRAEVADVPAITRLLGVIAAAARLEGCINVQLRLAEQGPRVFEINPRISSTVMMRHLLGFSDLVWWVEARSGGLPPFVAPKSGSMVFRLSREMVVHP